MTFKCQQIVAAVLRKPGETYHVYMDEMGWAESVTTSALHGAKKNGYIVHEPSVKGDRTGIYWPTACVVPGVGRISATQVKEYVAGYAERHPEMRPDAIASLFGVSSRSVYNWTDARVSTSEAYPEPESESEPEPEPHRSEPEPPPAIRHPPRPEPPRRITLGEASLDEYVEAKRALLVRLEAEVERLSAEQRVINERMDDLVERHAECRATLERLGG